jgi:hypothetical protein
MDCKAPINTEIDEQRNNNNVEATTIVGVRESAK